MRNGVKAIGPVYYATVRTEGAPVVESGKTDAILRGGGWFISPVSTTSTGRVATTGGSVTSSILFMKPRWHGAGDRL